MKKYKAIYDVLGNFPYVRYTDYSFWRYPSHAQTSITLNQPLHLVIEDRKEQKRIWVTKMGREYGITAANTRYSTDSREYSFTQKRFVFHTQRETAKTLADILGMQNRDLFELKAA